MNKNILHASNFCLVRNNFISFCAVNKTMSPSLFHNLLYFCPVKYLLLLPQPFAITLHSTSLPLSIPQPTLQGVWSAVGSLPLPPTVHFYLFQQILSPLAAITFLLPLNLSHILRITRFISLLLFHHAKVFCAVRQAQFSARNNPSIRLGFYQLIVRNMA